MQYAVCTQIMMLFSLVASYHHSAGTCSRLSAVSLFMDLKSRSELRAVKLEQRGTWSFVTLTATVKILTLRRRNGQTFQVEKNKCMEILSRVISL